MLSEDNVDKINRMIRDGLRKLDSFMTSKEDKEEIRANLRLFMDMLYADKKE